ncbi:hypothetical protein K2X85_19800 [bacterium]|nr:hypothetical protein [bacterium]
MGSGFHYGDPAKPDWDAVIKWSFLRHEGTSDWYRVEVAFRFEGEKSRARIMEVPFNGSQPAKIPVNEWLVVSMEATGALDEDLLRPNDL